MSSKSKEPKAKTQIQSDPKEIKKNAQLQSPKYKIQKAVFKTTFSSRNNSIASPQEMSVVQQITSFFEEIKPKESPCSDKVILKEDMLAQIKRAPRDQIMDKLVINYFNFKEKEKDLKRQQERIKLLRQNKSVSDCKTIFEKEKTPKGRRNQSDDKTKQKKSEEKLPLLKKRRGSLNQRRVGGYLNSIYEENSGKLVTLDVMGKIRSQLKEFIFHGIETSKIKSKEEIEAVQKSIQFFENKKNIQQSNLLNYSN